MDKVQKIREAVEKLKSNLVYGACSSQVVMETRCKEEAYNEMLAILDSKQEEPVSEFLNTESMIESYKQRLISQANGVKNSPLIDMCLASYKHGINETLDTLNLSSLARIGKNWKEPVSEELEEAAKRYATEGDEISGLYIIDIEADAFKAGAKWQKEHSWKSADGDDLPEIDKEVIVLTQPYPLENSEYAVSFAHRPNPNGWNGKSLTSGKVEHYTPKTYGKGGWNIPNIMYWLDVELPKE